MKPKFKRGDILEPVDGVGSNIRVIDYMPGYKYYDRVAIYKTESVEFVDGEWITTFIEMPSGKYYLERYYKLCTKAVRHEFLKDILK